MQSVLLKISYILQIIFVAKSSKISYILQIIFVSKKLKDFLHFADNICCKKLKKFLHFADNFVAKNFFRFIIISFSFIYWWHFFWQSLSHFLLFQKVCQQSFLPKYVFLRYWQLAISNIFPRRCSLAILITQRCLGFFG